MARIRLGMVGGGSGAFIGEVHRIASRIDGRFDLVAGALSSTPEKSRASAEELGLDPERAYGSFAEMAEAEANRDDGIEAVSIVTPNHMHFAAAKAFLDRGIHVICDKPLTATFEDAEAMERAVGASDALFVLTHNYTGYPMVRQAREMIENGRIGKVRIVQLEYPQDWMTDAVETAGVKQAEWRTDPERSGAGGAIGDIGTHAYNLGSFVTGLRGEELAADLQSFGAGRKLDDNAHILLRYEGGARGMLWCSQVAPGHENGLRLRVIGERGAIDWCQEIPNEMWFTLHGEPTHRLTRMGPGASEAANAMSRIPPGHPEGYLEAFANLYGEAAEAIRAVQGGEPRESVMGRLPGIAAGMEGMAFIRACVSSSGKNSAWTRI
ncbi:Gfo/Idh/MocA family oxidoreductase [Palleronia sp. LCG004]|uniref:Gfo/Idh/MocA family protein n=1 Tax=Palleronia sp. LCG004 TaxID=3079304 RepID=UPI002943B80A|nr:Gfo/Idh/MocA family oxidoreductase [Palleronia sp. LCG004]WOI57301.1 Gfo/Idh/MocA family oxidoreductase [Palleronia sp. LCG004]